MRRNRYQRKQPAMLNTDTRELDEIDYFNLFQKARNRLVFVGILVGCYLLAITDNFAKTNELITKILAAYLKIKTTSAEFTYLSKLQESVFYVVMTYWAYCGIRLIGIRSQLSIFGNRPRELFKHPLAWSDFIIPLLIPGMAIGYAILSM